MGRTYSKKRLYTKGGGSTSNSLLNLSSLTTTVDGALFTLPKGYTIEFFNIEETAGGTMTIQIGTTAGGNDIVGGYPISASTVHTATVDYTHSNSAVQIIYISDTGGGWGTASLDITAVLRKSN